MSYMWVTWDIGWF